MKVRRVWALALIKSGDSWTDPVSAAGCWALPRKGLASTCRPRAEKLTFWEYRIYTDSFLYHHYVNQGKEFHAVVLAKHNMAKSCYMKREACRQPATTTGGMLSTEAGFMQVMKAWKEYWNSTGWRGTRRAVQTSRRLGGFSVLQPVSI